MPLTDESSQPVTYPAHIIDWLPDLVFFRGCAWQVRSAGSSSVAALVVSGRSGATSDPRRRSRWAACCGGFRRCRWWPLRRGSRARWQRRAGRARGRRTGDPTVRRQVEVWARWSVWVRGSWRAQLRLAPRSALVPIAKLTSTYTQTPAIATSSIIYRPIVWHVCIQTDGLPTQVQVITIAVGRAQDRKSSPVKDQRFTALPRNQLLKYLSK